MDNFSVIIIHMEYIIGALITLALVGLVIFIIEIQNAPYHQEDINVNTFIKTAKKSISKDKKSDKPQSRIISPTKQQASKDLLKGLDNEDIL